jgi:CheY-like chemotaxis protein
MMPVSVSPSDTAPSRTPAGRVLVVDDDRAIRELFRRVLLFEGFDVVVAPGGAEGLRVLGIDPAIALVLLDLDMPGIDGRGFRRAQSSDPRLAGIPTVVVTAVLTDANRAELNATAYLNKPVPRARFIQIVERYCGRMADA